jgi:hypothetical protein
MKIFLKVISIFVLTIILWLSLITFDVFHSKYLLTFIQKLRGTLNYEGEEKGNETFSIFLSIYLPVCFGFSILIINAIFKFWKKNNGRLKSI